MNISYADINGRMQYLDGVTPAFVKPYVPLRTTVTFLPRALQPTHAAGGAGTSNPVFISRDRVELILALNPLQQQRSFLFSPNPGKLYREYANYVDWSSAVALVNNLVLTREIVGQWVRVLGVPLDARISEIDINPKTRPYWCHRVYVGNIFQPPRDPFWRVTYSPMWEGEGRELWIRRDYLSRIYEPVPPVPG